jgi:hypothetical protein
MLRRTLALVALAIAPAAVAPAPARAQFPGLTLTFTEPTGVVGPTDAIDIRVRIALDPGGAPLAIDGLSPGTLFGLPPALFPTEGYAVGSSVAVPFATYTDAPTAVAHHCVGGTFWLCPGGPYLFEFPATGYPGQYQYALLPGESEELLFGRYLPNPGPVPPGTYRFTGAAVGVIVYGADAGGTPISAFVQLARTCPTDDDSCAFTRTVLATPEPAGAALLAGGLVALAVAARRRRVA